MTRRSPNFPGWAGPRHKYGAKRDARDGITFDSKAEARYYDTLVLRQRAGEILFFLRQTPFHLPGGVVYRLDFLEFHADGSVHAVDVKGLETETFRVKRRLVESIYAPLTIETVTA